MELGLIGLGRMGGTMAARLRRAGHTVVGYDQSAESRRDVDSLNGLVDALPAPRAQFGGHAVEGSAGGPDTPDAGSSADAYPSA